MSAIALRSADKTIALEGPLAEIETDCTALHELDKRTEKAKTRLVVGCVLGFIGAFVGLALESWLLGLGSGSIAVVLLIAYFSINRHDIEDRKLEAARTVLDTFRDELKPGRPVALSIDFRGYDHARASDAWLSLRFTLENGVVVHLAATTRYKRKKRRKRKYTKLKDKLREELTLRFSPPKGSAFSAGTPAQLRVLPVRQLALRSTRVEPKAATFVYTTGPMLRVRGRGGWEEGGIQNHILVGPTMVRALIASYRGLAAAEAAA